MKFCKLVLDVTSNRKNVCPVMKKNANNLFCKLLGMKLCDAEWFRSYIFIEIWSHKHPKILLTSKNLFNNEIDGIPESISSCFTSSHK